MFLQANRTTFGNLRISTKVPLNLRPIRGNFLLKGGEIAFHKPNEFHKLAADKGPPNVTVASFVCNSDAMKLLKTKFLSDFARNARFCPNSKRRSCGVRAADISAAYYGNARKANAPFAAKQLTFNLLERFLITLLRRSEPAIRRKAAA